MKITVTFDDDARRILAKARNTKTTRRGLATREELQGEVDAVLDAHWDTLQDDAKINDEREAGD